MQHLLLAISIISLTIIAGNGHRKDPVAKSNATIKIEKPAIDDVESDLPADKPAFFITRFDMFLY